MARGEGNGLGVGEDVSVTASLDQLSKRLDVRPSVLARMMPVILNQDHWVGQLDARLRELAIKHTELIEWLRTEIPQAPQVKRLRAAAARAMEEGDLASPDTFL